MPLIRRDAPPAPAADPAAADLERGTIDERWAAARRLAGRADAAARLGQALAAETSDQVREAMFTSLVQTGGRAGVEAVLPHLKADDAALRTGALDALKAMPDAARDHLPALLADPDADVRILACELARAVPGAQAAGLLAGLIAAEPDVNVCAAAIDVLAEIGTPDQGAALATCLARFSGQPFLAFAVKVALRRIGVQAPSGHG